MISKKIGICRLSKFRGNVSQDSGASADGESESLRKKRVQIHSMREVGASSDADYNSPDVQFILEVKRSNVKVTSIHVDSVELNSVHLKVYLKL